MPWASVREIKAAFVMVEKEFTVNNKLGLHARPASLFVKTTGRYESDVKVVRGEHEVDGKSIMGLLLLAAGPGTVLKVVARGSDEADVIRALDDLFARKFDDEDRE